MWEASNQDRQVSIIFFGADDVISSPRDEKYWFSPGPACSIIFASKESHRIGWRTPTPVVVRRTNMFRKASHMILL